MSENEVVDFFIFGLVVLFVLGAGLALLIHKIRAFNRSRRRWRERQLKRREG